MKYDRQTSLENEAWIKYLVRRGWNIPTIAGVLGLSYNTVHGKCRGMGLSPKRGLHKIKETVLMRFECKLEFDASDSLTPVDVMKHVLKAMEQYQTRAGFRFTELSVGNPRAYNYKHEQQGKKP